MAENNKEIDSLRQALEKLRLNNKERHFIRGNIWVEDVNKTESDLRTILFTAAVFLFTFSSPLFTQVKNLSVDEKLLLFLAWIFLFVSLICGFIQIVIDIIFFVKGTARENKGEKIWSKVYPTMEEYEKNNEETGALYSDFSAHSSLIPLVIQVIFLVLGFLSILGSASLVLLRLPIPVV